MRPCWLPTGRGADASPIDPLIGTQAATTLEADRRLSPSEALQLFTTSAALLAAEGQAKDAMAPGTLADFAMPHRNPPNAEPDSSVWIQALET